MPNLLSWAGKKKKVQGAEDSSANTEETTIDPMYEEIEDTKKGNLSMCKIANALKKVSEKLYHNCNQSTFMESGTSSHKPGLNAAQLQFREGNYGSNPRMNTSHGEQILPAPALPRARAREGIYDRLKPNEVQKAENANAEVLNLLERAKNINGTASEALIELQEAFKSLNDVTKGEKAPEKLIFNAIQKLNKAKLEKNKAIEITSLNVEEQKTKVETALKTYNKERKKEKKYIEEIESYISTIKLKQTELESEQELVIDKIIEIDNAVTQAESIKQSFNQQFIDAEYMTAEAVPHPLQANASDTALKGAAPAPAPAPPTETATPAAQPQVVSSSIPPEPTIEREIFEKASKGAQAAAAAKAAAAKSAATTAETQFSAGGGSRKLTKKRKTKKGKKSRKSTKKGKSKKSKLAKQKYKKGKKSKMRKKYNKKTKRVNNNNTNTKK